MRAISSFEPPTDHYYPRDDKFWVLKVHISTLKHNQELLVSKHLSDVNFDHAGKKHVRQFQQTFKLNGPHGEHDVFVMRPLGMSLRTLQELQKDKVFQKDLVIGALDQALLGLDYLHDANVIHTGEPPTCPFYNMMPD